jgi:hypothetical protein
MSEGILVNEENQALRQEIDARVASKRIEAAPYRRNSQ